jgi:tetratricopeptide (TPR) repeat protein
VIGPLRQQTQVIELLRQRVMAGFAVVFQPAFGDWNASGIPPTYAAYQEVLAASDDVWAFKADEAIPHLRRAIAADSTYIYPKAQLAYALSATEDCRGVDSIKAALEPMMAQLTPGDRGTLAYAEAACRRDRAGKLAAARALLQAGPQSIGATVLGAIDAIELGRPREAIEILHRFDARRLPLSDQQAAIYWDFTGYAEHDLAMIAQDSNGGRIPAGSVLASVADSGAVARALEGALQHPDNPDLPGDQCTVMELGAHGSAAASKALLERIAEARGPKAAADVEDTPCLWNLYSPHYYAGRFEEARAAYERRVAADTADVKAHGALAAIAARLGDSTALEAQLRWLAASDHCLAYLARARIAVIRGNPAEAVALLRQALERDVERHWLHLDPDLAPLRGYPPFRELMRFRG